MSIERRRDTRYRYHLDITIKIGGKQQSLRTEDVSYRGLFARTDTLPVMRQLISIEAVLPPDEARFSSHGMAVFLVPPEDPNGRVPGAGIQFYAINDRERKKWETFIRSIVAEAPEVTHAREEPPPSEPIRRASERLDVVLAVKPRNASDLLTMFTRDVSSGGMFLMTNRELEVGSELRLDVKHPDDEAVFPIACIVRRRSTEDPIGIGVEFTDMSAERRREFYDFAQRGVPVIDEADLELVDLDDPLLL